MGVKTRIIPVLLYDEHGCVKGRGFDKSRRIGSIQDRLRLLDRRDIDELILLDIAATPHKRGPRFEEISRLLENVFCPCTVGGGVRSIPDIARLLKSGADKVAIGTAAIEQPELINEAAEKFGAQAIVVSIDVAGDRLVAARCGRAKTERNAREWAQECEMRGAGEILLTSIERDGMMEGMDLDLIAAVSDAVSIPVVAAGGCGSYEHMKQALDAGAHAVASGAMFQFTDQTPKGAARYLSERGIPTRI